MAARGGVDPLRRFRLWWRQARNANVALAEAMALATVTSKGRSSVRYLLLKEVDHRGFVFYTNSRSRKGKELERVPFAALAFYWHATGKQVRCEGRIEKLPKSAADAYWAGRPRASQIASMASDQSAPLAKRADMLARVKVLERRYRGKDVPRPLHWIGYRLVPNRIEFWTRCEPRLHHREELVKTNGRWKRRLLQP